MRDTILTVYKFSELSETAQERAAIDYGSRNGIDYGAEMIESLKGFCSHFNLKLNDYSFGGSFSRDNNVSISLGNNGYYSDDIAELHGVRLWKYLHNYIEPSLLDGNCPFTCVCYDENLLDPLREFIKLPDSRTFIELMRDCTAAWLTAVVAEVDYQGTAEYMADLSEANDYEYTIDGELH